MPLRIFFRVFNNADLDFGTVTDEDGKTVQLTHGRYLPFLESQNVRVRREAFEKVYAAYKQFKNTLAAAFDANVQQERFLLKCEITVPQWKWNSTGQYPGFCVSEADRGGTQPHGSYASVCGTAQTGAGCG